MKSYQIHCLYLLLLTNRSPKYDIVIITEHIAHQHQVAYKNEGEPSHQLKIK
jgi:hypothetical protein